MLNKIIDNVVSLVNYIFHTAVELICETYEDITIFFAMIAEYFKSNEIKPYSKFFIGFSIFIGMCGLSILDIISIWFIGFIGGFISAFIGAFIILIIQLIYESIKEKKIDKE